MIDSAFVTNGAIAAVPSARNEALDLDLLDLDLDLR